ncbi:MAG: hypothetical protein Q9191_008036 [Dirinaria sp. TL-2023a]
MANLEDTCILFSLPLELRLQIYDYVCEDLPHTFCRLRLHMQDDQECPQPCAYDGLLRTCKQIHAEVLSLIYSEGRVYSLQIPIYEDTVGFPSPNSGLHLMKHVDLEYVFPDNQRLSSTAMDAHIASCVSRFRSVRTLTLRLPRWVEGPFPGLGNHTSATAAALAELEIEECLCVAVQVRSKPHIEAFEKMLEAVAPHEQWTFEFHDRAWIGVTNGEIRAWWYPKERTPEQPSSQVRDIVGFPFRTGKVHGIMHYPFSERDANGKAKKSSLIRIDYVPAPPLHYSFPRP